MRSVSIQRLSGILLLGVALMVLAVPAAQAQPFNTWLQLQGYPTSGYLEIPSSPALNPTAGFTFEAWVNVTITSGSCVSIAGKNWHKSWWIGACLTGGKQVLRSYVRGFSGSGEGPGTFHDAGEIQPGKWTHVAVVFNGTTRLHYINGEFAGSWPEPGPLTTSPDPVRFGSDVNYTNTPQGGIDEVHLWSVGRTLAQIRADLAAPITSAQPGLISVWPLDATGTDIIGGHSGVGVGSGVSVGNFPVMASCGSSTVSQLCLQNRFLITTAWRTGPVGTAPNGDGSVVVAGANSGIFWFFSSDNWEVMVKALNGCALNSHYWIYSAATTNVYYRMDVLDVRSGQQKIYFNYPGPPAPAVTDSNAFGTCP
ncbi:MAG TPA: LamG domain-containing protein [Thermoanaerobaculia bacterium]|jgi:hypothetical protein